MHRFKFLIAVITLLMLGTATAALADSSSTQSLAADAVVNGDYLAAAGTVTVAGTVNGDVYVAGGTVNVSGIVNGDVIVTGGTVSVAGKVSGSIRGAAGNLTVSGEVDRNVTVAGGTVELQQSASVHGNVYVAGGNVIIVAPVGGTVKAKAGNLTLQGTIGGSVEARVGQLTVASTARLNGPLTYTSSQTAQIDSGAQINGPVVQHLTPVKPKTDHSALRAGLQLWLLVSELLLGVVVVAVLPKASARVAATLALRPWLSLGVGFAALIAAPFAILFVAFTFIGVPLAIAGALIYGLALMFASVVTGLWIGHWIVKLAHWKLHPVVSYLLGATVLWALSLLPWVGFIIMLLAVVLGLGAQILSTTTSDVKKQAA